jgi:hypothetical protein
MSGNRIYGGTGGGACPTCSQYGANCHCVENAQRLADSVDAYIKKVAKSRWRVGRKLGRTLYVDDVCVGMVDTASLAEEIVGAMNGTPTEWWGIQDADGRWWPRRFRTEVMAQDHMHRCEGPRTKATVRKIPV